ncbi:MAG: hypothetical protein ABWW65_01985 [Thermoprotei archaeon]
MYDFFLRVLREEIESTKLVNIHLTSFNDYRSYIKNILAQASISSGNATEYVSKLVENIMRDTDMLAKIRIFKAIFNAEIPEETIDKDIVSSMRKLVDFLKTYLSGFLVTYEDKVICKLNSSLNIGKHLYRRGDLIFVEPKLASLLFINDAIECFTYPLIKMIISKLEES